MRKLCYHVSCNDSGNARELHKIIAERDALKLINNKLSLHGFSIQDFGLSDIFNALMECNDHIEDDINEDELVKKFQSLNDCQHKIFIEITTAVSGDNEKKNYVLLTVLVELEKVTY